MTVTIGNIALKLQTSENGRNDNCIGDQPNAPMTIDKLLHDYIFKGILETGPRLSIDNLSRAIEIVSDMSIKDSEKDEITTTLSRLISFYTKFPVAYKEALEASGVV